MDFPGIPDIRKFLISEHPDFRYPKIRISGNPKISLRITYWPADYVLDRIDLAIRITYYVLSLPGPLFTRVQVGESAQFTKEITYTCSMQGHAKCKGEQWTSADASRTWKCEHGGNYRAGICFLII